VIPVLVVEDEPILADAHAMYVRRVPGFEVAAVAGTGYGALAALRSTPVDLVLLDLNLPDLHGLDLLRAIRTAGHPVDVIAVTSARDLEVVRAAVSQGVLQYLLKPFVFASLRDKLERYREYRDLQDGLAAGGAVSGQHEIDQLLSAGRGQVRTPLPKGMSAESLAAIAGLVRDAGTGRSAAEVAAALEVSRVTARRYLEHLTESGVTTRQLRYRGPGRPEVEYRWVRTHS